MSEINFSEMSFFSSAEESQGFLLWRVSTLWRKSIEAVLHPLGLTHPQFVVLATTAWLTRKGDKISQVEIGKQAALDPNTISQILRGLEAKGLIERSHILNEKSKNPILTIVGIESLKKAMRAVEQADAAFFASIDQEESHLLKILQTLSQQSHS